jgi:hypothetical protein
MKEYKFVMYENLTLLKRVYPHKEAVGVLSYLDIKFTSTCIVPVMDFDMHSFVLSSSYYFITFVTLR